MDPDPFLRHSFWTISIGSAIHLISSVGIHPGSVQRFVALPTYEKAGKSLIYFIIGMAVICTMTGILGMLMYTKYKDCDPVKANVSMILEFHIVVIDNLNLITYFTLVCRQPQEFIAIFCSRNVREIPGTNRIIYFRCI